VNAPEDALAGITKVHRPNYVTEGVWSLDPERSTLRTRVKCDGADCDFYAEERSWYAALDLHSAHLAQVLAEYVAEREAQAARKALDAVERTVGMSGFRFGDPIDHAEALAIVRECRKRQEADRG
jgi:hypothetical protein